MSHPFPLRCTALHIMKPVLPKGGQSILFGAREGNEATEDSDRHPRGHRREQRFFSTSSHNTLDHNNLLKQHSYRDVSGFTVFSQFSQQRHVLPRCLAPRQSKFICFALGFCVIWPAAIYTVAPRQSKFICFALGFCHIWPAAIYTVAPRQSK